MGTEEILHQIERGTGRFARAAVEAAVARREEITASTTSLLPADCCQRGLPFTSSGGRTEFVWKCDIRLGCKALRLKAEPVGQIHYCQLGEMGVVRGSTKNKALTDFQPDPSS
jgi:hypothetical protein